MFTHLMFGLFSGISFVSCSNDKQVEDENKEQEENTDTNIDTSTDTGIDTGIDTNIDTGIDTSTDPARDGETIYNDVCLSCHGSGGTGPNLSFVITQLTDEEVEGVLIIGNSSMPSQNLSPEEMDNIIDYLRNELPITNTDRSAQTIHDAICMYCHSAKEPDLAVVVPSFVDAQLENIITNGSGYMIPQTLTSGELSNIIDYLRQIYP